MPQQGSLWDFLEQGASKEEFREAADKEASRRRAFKRLRAGGHWLHFLRVARSLPQPFTLNDASVAAWKAHPEFFAMKGYPFPDNHKVHSILYGRRGLVAKGIIKRERQGLFRVPEGFDPESLARAAKRPSPPGE